MKQSPTVGATAKHLIIIAATALLTLGAAHRIWRNENDPAQKDSPSTINHSMEKSKSIAVNECILDSRDIFFHAHFLIEYTQPNKYTSSYIYQLKCSTETNECEGASLTTNNLENNAPITSMDLNRMDKGELVASTGTTAIVKWGPLRTFSIDFVKGTISYVESGEGMISGHTEGRAVSRCGVIDMRRCKDDVGCLPGHRCDGGICLQDSPR